MQDKILYGKTISPKISFIIYGAVFAASAYLFSDLRLHGPDLSVAVSFIVGMSAYDKRAGYFSLFMLLGAFSVNDPIITANAVLSSVMVMIFSMFIPKKNNLTYSLFSMNITLISGLITYKLYSPEDMFLVSTVLSSAVSFITGGVFASYFSVLRRGRNSMRLTPWEEFSFIASECLIIAAWGANTFAVTDISLTIFTVYILYLGRNNQERCMPAGLIYGLISVIFLGGKISDIVLYSSFGYFSTIYSRRKNYVYFSMCILSMILLSGIMRINFSSSLPELLTGVILAGIILPIKDRFTDKDDRLSSSSGKTFEECADMMINKEISVTKDALMSLVKGIEGPYYEREIYTQVCRETVSEICMKCENYPLCWLEDGERTFEGFRRDVMDCCTDKGEYVFSERCDEEKRKLLALSASQAYISLKAEDDYIKKTKVFLDTFRSITEHLVNMLDAMALNVSKNITFYGETSLELLGIIRENGIDVSDAVITSSLNGDMRVMIKSNSPLGENETCRIIRNIISSFIKREFCFSYPDQTKSSGGYIYVYEEEYERSLKISFASRTKSGEEYSGDSIISRNFSHMQLCAVSDGMGSGKEASDRSRKVINMVQSLICAGYEYESAVDMINGILTFSGTSEIFTTLDMLLFDRRTNRAVFFKAGAESSYIRRGEEIIKITGETLPIGILESTHTKAVNIDLKKGDYVYMFSDGIVSSFDYDEEYIKNLILKTPHRFPQKIADEILNSALEVTGGEAEDDISVVVMKLR